jgi:hypothetical protein
MCPALRICSTLRTPPLGQGFTQYRYCEPVRAGYELNLNAEQIRYVSKEDGKFFPMAQQSVVGQGILFIEA